jgi:dienelactone hydrolase
MAPPEHVTELGQELAAAKCDWQLHAYGGTTHAFMVPDAAKGSPDLKDVLRHNPVAEVRAWNAAMDLLNDVFGQHGIDQA